MNLAETVKVVKEKFLRMHVLLLKTVQLCNVYGKNGCIRCKNLGIIPGNFITVGIF